MASAIVRSLLPEYHCLPQHNRPMTLAAPSQTLLALNEVVSLKNFGPRDMKTINRIYWKSVEQQLLGCGRTSL